MAELVSLLAGMALGTGSALAHRAVDGILGSRNPEPAQAQQAAEQVCTYSLTACCFAGCCGRPAAGLTGRLAAASGQHYQLVAGLASGGSGNASALRALGPA